MSRASRWPAYAAVALLAGLLAFVAPTRAPSAAADEPAKPAAAKPTTAALEELLKQTKVDYIPKEGYLLVPVTMDDETTLVSMTQDGIGDDPKLRVACLDTKVLDLPSNAKPSQALLRKMAELNDDYVVGRLSLDSDGIWYGSSFWLNRADTDILAAELVLAHIARKDARKELMPFLQE